MRIYLNEIGTEDTELDFNQNEKWVTEAVQRVDEHYADERPQLSRAKGAKAKTREIAAHLSLRKVDDVIVVNGSVNTYVELICSRCANPFKFETRPNFSALFCKDPVMAGVGHQTEDGKPAGQNKGFARHAHDYGSENGESSGSETQDLDITYLSQDFIELGDVLTEQLRLQIPFQPLCKADCKGICPQCGADLNVGRCACAKITKSNAFSVLKDYKVSS